ncbi:MAG TPA: hypothetical protein VFB78_05560 [Acidimicrobiales bacterium]|nr:hypothetical protein [Acidimicrobiales bacterium]
MAGLILLATGMWPGATQAATTITVSPITAKFFANPTDTGEFTATPSTAVDFTLTVPVLNWNPPTAAQVTCSNATNVNENSRPFTAVVPQSNGTCTTIQAVGNGISAGCDAGACTGYTGPDRNAFDAEFEGSFTVDQPGQVTFNFFSDDGWILGVGASGANQATHVSGGDPSPPALTTSPFKSYKVVGQNNTTHPPTQDDLVVNFPAAGVYPFELDYSEAAAGELAMTMTAGGAPIGSTPTSSTSSTISTSSSSTSSSSTTSSSTTSTTALATTTTRSNVLAATVTGRPVGDLTVLGLGLLFAGVVLLAGRKISEIPLEP